MIEKTRGIVLNYIRYQESGIICKIYTEKHGLLSVIVHGIRSQRSKRSIGFFQPFSLLELEVYFKPNRDIQNLSEYRFIKSTPTISQDMVKNAVVLFLSETVGKILSGEKEPHPLLFEFMMQSIIEFDSLTQGAENFHLHFLLVLPNYLGFGPENALDLMDQLHLQEDTELGHLVQQLIDTPYDHPLKANGKQRYQLLEVILSYYRLHTPYLGEVKSLKVLHSIFA